MRINDWLVVQYINSEPAQLVFVDDSSGREVTRPCTVDEIRALMTEIVAAQKEGRALDLDGIEMAGTDLVVVPYALGYFTGVASA